MMRDSEITLKGSTLSDSYHHGEYVSTYRKPKIPVKVASR